MPARSAPTANILTFRSSIDFISLHSRPNCRCYRPLPEDRIRRLGKRRDTLQRLLGLLLLVSIVDKETRAPGSLSCLDIAPTIANHERLCELDAVACCCVEQGARLGLAAFARFAVVVT